MPDTLLQGSSDGFDSIVGHLDYPMFIVTTRSGEELSGCLVGFATQAGIDPARFLVGLSEKNRTFRIAKDVENLAVHVLPAGARELAELFGGRTGDDIDKFARCSWTEGPHGLPILDEAAGWFTGRILGQFELGDHVGFLLEPDRGELREDSSGLLTFADVKDIDAGHDA
ncbi:flavin reductase family protein [Rhodococcus sp. B50]|uniref:flavin reductase family protein n=1 Tax=Rhodococcus sp. B50 TaxID=2682847 RepID=UPI0019E26DC7|nr:flavin reductase family protein [Rhodococcus sp. B50]MBS9373685.1 4-hydroxyphenylacetate 3-monooxygenase reductase component [Rhodococcus sp. B50]